MPSIQTVRTAATSFHVTPIGPARAVLFPRRMILVLMMMVMMVMVMTGDDDHGDGSDGDDGEEEEGGDI